MTFTLLFTYTKDPVPCCQGRRIAGGECDTVEKGRQLQEIASSRVRSSHDVVSKLHNQLSLGLVSLMLSGILARVCVRLEEGTEHYPRPDSGVQMLGQLLTLASSSESADLEFPSHLFAEKSYFSQVSFSVLVSSI